MPYPKPEPGLVIGYSYLWSVESGQGQVEGLKDRPCAIVLSVRNDEGEQIVTLVPITHTQPSNPEVAIEVPQPTKQRLGLGDERSWIVLSEYNQFVWPGPDLRPIPRSHNDQYHYGFLPPKLFDQLKKKLLEQIREQQVQAITRTE
ncbi:MAG: hypothetical protein ABW185_04545 [Sedimenticola sp.]